MASSKNAHPSIAGDMSKAVFRYLAESEWRKEGRLGTLVCSCPISCCLLLNDLPQMQRVTQMDIVPDVLPRIDPDVDLQIWHNGGEVVPGSMVEASQVGVLSNK